jgi:alpha-glucosidase
LVSGDKILMDTPDPIDAFERYHVNERVLCVFNFSNAPATMKVAEGWHPVAGHGFEAAFDGTQISLPPFGVFFATEPR